MPSIRDKSLYKKVIAVKWVGNLLDSSNYLHHAAIRSRSARQPDVLSDKNNTRRVFIITIFPG